MVETTPKPDNNSVINQALLDKLKSVDIFAYDEETRKRFNVALVQVLDAADQIGPTDAWPCLKTVLNILNDVPGIEVWLDGMNSERLALTTFNIWQPRLPKNADARVITIGGIRYRPIPDAAAVAQAPRQSFMNWIRNKTQFDGQPLEGILLVDRYMVSDRSIMMAARRFIHLPEGNVAKAIHLGSKDDKTGYIGMKEAAQQLGVARPTITLWASDYKKSPTDHPLDVIRCKTSGQLFIRENDLEKLAKYVPQAGLSRGPRPHSLRL